MILITIKILLVLIPIYIHHNTYWHIDGRWQRMPFPLWLFTTFIIMGILPFYFGIGVFIIGLLFYIMFYNSFPFHHRFFLNPNE